MKKLERYEHPCMFDVAQCKLDGYYCTDEDVARLEASQAELLEAAKMVMKLWTYGISEDNPFRYLRAAIAKAEGGHP